jgi:two-component sensor histidine kinase
MTAPMCGGTRNRPTRVTDARAMQKNHLTLVASHGESTNLTESVLQQVRGGATSSKDSGAIEFESIKNDIQKLTQMQQALGNIVKTLHEEAMNAIRHIRG